MPINESSITDSQKTSSNPNAAGNPDQTHQHQDEHADNTEKRSRTGGAPRGFAAMDAERQRAIASKGGHSQGKGNNPGNFANNRERARAAGRKGGMA
jgi:general stress protein YciG